MLLCNRYTIQMAQSKKRTTVSVVRQITGLKAKAFGDLINRSEDWVKGAESGRVKLNFENALAIKHATGVSLTWLLDGAPNSEPFVEDSYEAIPFTRQAFDERQAMLFSGKATILRNFGELGGDAEKWSELEIFAQITLVLTLTRQAAAAALQSGKEELVVYHLAKAVADVVQRYGASTSREMVYQHFRDLKPWATFGIEVVKKGLDHVAAETADAQRMNAVLQCLKLIRSEDVLGFFEFQKGRRQEFEFNGGIEGFLYQHVELAVNAGIDLSPPKKASESKKKRP